LFRRFNASAMILPQHIALGARVFLMKLQVLNPPYDSYLLLTEKCPLRSLNEIFNPSYSSVVRIERLRVTPAANSAWRTQAYWWSDKSIFSLYFSHPLQIDGGECWEVVFHWQ